MPTSERPYPVELLRMADTDRTPLRYDGTLVMRLRALRPRMVLRGAKPDRASYGRCASCPPGKYGAVASTTIVLADGKGKSSGAIKAALTSVTLPPTDRVIAAPDKGATWARIVWLNMASTAGVVDLVKRALGGDAYVEATGANGASLYAAILAGDPILDWSLPVGDTAPPVKKGGTTPLPVGVSGPPTVPPTLPVGADAPPTGGAAEWWASLKWWEKTGVVLTTAGVLVAGTTAVKGFLPQGGKNLLPTGNRAFTPRGYTPGRW